MLEAIGNTPLVRLSRIVPKGAADVWVKLEYYNPTGSYKDRMALAMVERAEQRGVLKPGMTVVEYTGGSTGISLAFVCAVKGYRCRIVCNDAVAPEKLRSMQVFGAELEVLKSDGGKLTPDLVPRMMARARKRGRGTELRDRPDAQSRHGGRLRAARRRAAATNAGADSHLLRRGRHGRRSEEHTSELQSLAY